MYRGQAASYSASIGATAAITSWNSEVALWVWICVASHNIEACRAFGPLFSILGQSGTPNLLSRRNAPSFRTTARARSQPRSQLDGHQPIGVKTRGEITLYLRNHNNFNKQCPQIL